MLRNLITHSLYRKNKEFLLFIQIFQLSLFKILASNTTQFNSIAFTILKKYFITKKWFFSMNNAVVSSTVIIKRKVWHALSLQQQNNIHKASVAG